MKRMERGSTLSMAVCSKQSRSWCTRTAFVWILMSAVRGKHSNKKPTTFCSNKQTVRKHHRRSFLPQYPAKRLVLPSPSPYLCLCLRLSVAGRLYHVYFKMRRRWSVAQNPTTGKKRSGCSIARVKVRQPAASLLIYFITKKKKKKRRTTFFW